MSKVTKQAIAIITGNIHLFNPIFRTADGRRTTTPIVLHTDACWRATQQDLAKRAKAAGGSVYIGPGTLEPRGTCMCCGKSVLDTHPAKPTDVTPETVVRVVPLPKMTKVRKKRGVKGTHKNA
jgi:hypothetical protein